MDTKNVFSYHKPKDDQPRRYELIRAVGKSLADHILQNCPDSDERDQALTKVREAVMWANASIACNEMGPA